MPIFIVSYSYCWVEVVVLPLTWYFNFVIRLYRNDDDNHHSEYLVWVLRIYCGSNPDYYDLTRSMHKYQMVLAQAKATLYSYP